ncbi:MAG: phosphopentomutase [Bacillota bacterium]|nr:phosphopentomutase [Bacillota bacterium]
MNKRVITIVLDSVGIGALPDAAEYGDAGSHTLGNICSARGTLNLPNMSALGLAHIAGSNLAKPGSEPTGAFGRAAEQTAAKDTTSGHWELMGLPMDVPFRTFQKGFPAEFIRAFEKRIGRRTLYNLPASGTAVIAELGDEHVRTGSPIVYTSADSVFQIAAHEDVIPLEELYGMCRTAREMLVGDMLVGRVIARPFTGSTGSYTRTQNRKDFAVPPPGETVLDALKAEGIITAGIGKIEDIFYNRGICLSDHTHTNEEGVDATLRFMREENFGFLFVNLVDFDMIYGHRNDIEGYARALEKFDGHVPELLSAMKNEDILMITADHGCDPTTASTDHSREYIPVIVAGSGVKPGVDLGTRGSFSDIGATVYEYLTGKAWSCGKSFLPEIKD